MLLQTVRIVFSQVSSWLIAGAVAVVTLSGIVLTPNISLLLSVLSSQALHPAEKLSFWWSLYGGLLTTMSLFSAVVVGVVCVLFGVNTALLVQYVRQRRSAGGGLQAAARAASTTTLAGTLAALLGMGCALCGTAVVFAVLQLLGIGWIVTLLPLHGAEFGLVGIALLLWVAHNLCQKIAAPAVCAVD